MQRSLVFLLPAIALWIAGCKLNFPQEPAPLDDRQALLQIVTSIDSITQFLASDEATIDDGGLQLVGAGGNALPEAVRSELDRQSPFGTTADSVVEWGRFVFRNQITRGYTVAFSDDTLGFVAVTRYIPCDFLVAWGIHQFHPVDTVLVDTIIHKPFTEVSKRIVRFRRISVSNQPLYNWVVDAITFVISKTAGSITFGIDTLSLSDPQQGFDTAHTMPLQTWFRFGSDRESIPVFRAGDSVTVRLTVSGTDSLPEIVTLHYGIAGVGALPFRARMFLVSETGTAGNHTRTFQRRFGAQLPDSVTLGRFTALTDVFPRRCIYSKMAPFENEFWGMPYIAVH